jgi:hypothetical protein
MYRDVGVRRMPRGLRHVALSISFLSPIVRRPDAFAVTKIASLIFRPERRFLAVTSFHSLRRPSLSFGSSSLISLRRQSLSLSRARLRPPGNIQSPSRFRLTSSTCPRLAATSFEDFAIPYKHHLSTHPVILTALCPSPQPGPKHNEGRLSWRPLHFPSTPFSRPSRLHAQPPRRRPFTRMSDDLQYYWRPPRRPRSTQAGFF